MRTFDWVLLQEVVAQNQIDTDEILRNEQRLFNLHYFYGLDEMELGRLIGLTMDVADSRVNMDALEQNVLNNYTRRHSVQNNSEQPAKNHLRRCKKNGKKPALMKKKCSG